MRSQIATADSNGFIYLPGGYCARIASGAVGTVLPFPVTAYYDDIEYGNFVAVFFDNGPTPLRTKRINGGTGKPALILTGLTQGSKVAYQVAETQEEALYMAAGLPFFQTDSSGRLILIGASNAGAAPTTAPLDIAWDGTLTRRILTDVSGREIPAEVAKTRVTHVWETTLNNTATAACFALGNSGSKVVRIWRVRCLWPGKQTTGAKASMYFLQGTTRTSGGTDDIGITTAIDSSDTLPCVSHLWHNRGGTGINLSGAQNLYGDNALSGNFFYIPAADGSFQPFDIYNFDSPNSLKEIKLTSSQYFCGQWATAPGPGYDNNFRLQIIFSEE